MFLFDFVSMFVTDKLCTLTVYLHITIHIVNRHHRTARVEFEGLLLLLLLLLLSRQWRSRHRRRCAETVATAAATVPRLSPSDVGKCCYVASALQRARRLGAHGEMRGAGAYRVATRTACLFYFIMTSIVYLV